MAPKVNANAPNREQNKTNPATSSGLSCQNWPSQRGMGLTLTIKCTRETQGWGKYGLEQRAVDSREPSFDPGFIEFKLCRFIHLYKSTLGLNWLSTAFTVKGEFSSRPTGLGMYHPLPSPLTLSSTNQPCTAATPVTLSQIHQYTSAPGPLH